MSADPPQTTLLHEATLRFHGVDYLITLRSSPASLSHAPALLLSARASDGLWHASFSASEIEQMSSKTGAFQPFATMERMIGRCIEASGGGGEDTHQIVWKHGMFDTLSIDLLTYEQLDLLKQRRSTDTPVAAAAYTPRSNARRALNKRYVILTLSSESSPEDRIHYPLPLLFQGRPVDSPAASTAALDVTALREQLAKLTHDIQQNGQEQPAAQQAEQQQTPQRRPQQRMQHSASAIDTRSYHRSRSRSRSSSPPPRSRSRSRSRSPPRRSSHKSSSSSRKGSSRSHKESSSSSSSSAALAAENERLKAELESLRILSASESARHSTRRGDLPSPSSSSLRSGRLHRIQSPDDPSSALSDSEGASAASAAPAGLDDAARSLEAIAASRTIEASEAFIASLQSQLSEARAAASFEAEVAAARIAGLEAENRSLRRAENAARAALHESETLLKAATIESARLRSARADSPSARTAAAAAAASPVRTAGRPRSASPLLKRSQNGSSSLPVLRGGNGAAQSPSRRSPSPYLQAQRDRRNGGAGSNASSRGSSPAGSGRGTLTHSRGNSASSARSATTGAAGVPPLPGIRSRSSSPAMRARPASASPSRSTPQSPQQPPRAPIDLSYRSWTVDRSGRSSPIRRFDPVAYVERRKSLQAEKEDRIRLRNEMEIARVTTPTRSLSPSMSSASSTGTLNRSSSPARRALNLSASTPSLEFVQSPGRGALRPSSRPDGYVGSSASPARSRARGTVAVAVPVNARGGRPSNGDLARAGVLGMNDPLMFSARGGSSPAPSPSSASAASTSTAEFRAARTRELLQAQSLQRASGSSAAAPAPNGSSGVLPPASRLVGLLGYTARLPLEPLIPSLDGIDDGATEDATPRTQAKQVTALTARLAKLQHFLEAEKAN